MPVMKRLLCPLIFLLTAAILLPGVAAAQAHTASFELVADRTAYAPGETARLAAWVDVEAGWHVNSNQPTQDYLIPTELQLEIPADFGIISITYPPDSPFHFPAEEEPVLVYDGRFRIVAELEVPATIAEGSVPVAAALRYQSCNDKQCLPPVSLEAELDLRIGSGGVASLDFDGTGIEIAMSHTPAAASSQPRQSLFVMLLLGVLGGFILNAMPCVLPVLSLKVFGLVESAGKGRSHLVIGALATTAGILLSFWLLAAAAIAASKAGAAVGWGMQFQQPAFVAFLALVMVLFALNMWGLFEIQLPQKAYQLGASGSGEGLGGHFLTGFFATLMATPCSAPFLGTALGFALGQPALIVLLMFTAIGLGLALPYLILAAVPSAARLLPKPGQWMVTFRSLMGFCLAAASVWLFYVLAGQIDPAHLAFVQLALLAVAMFVWLAHGAPRPSARRKMATGGLLLAAFGTLWLAQAAPPAVAAATGSSKLIDWVAFDETEANRLTSDGRIVFVDFTAKWCLTCKANEKAVIETTPVAEAFDRHEVVAMKADWTNRDDAITEFLARYDRAAVPFYIMMRPGQEPHVFGEILTQKGLLEVVEQSATRISSVVP